MIEKLKPYPTMKDVGPEWLGNVPSHWDVRRVKVLLREVDERTTTGTERLLSLRQERGLVDHHDSGGKPVPPEALIGFKRTRPGQLVMNRMRAAAGLFAATPEPGIVSPDYAVFSPRSELRLDYYVHLFKTPLMAGVFRSESRGLGTGESGFLRLYTDRFGAILMPYPSLSEQTAIARFVAYVDANIRRYISSKKKLIRSLEEQKQAIVNRAVTRGLDPNVRLKASGVEWLGDVPEHWEVSRLRRLAERVTSGSRGWSNYAADAGPVFIRIGNLTRVSIDLDLSDAVRLRLPPTG
jgi:type I restriction enzyme S subunit